MFLHYGVITTIRKLCTKNTHSRPTALPGEQHQTTAASTVNARTLNIIGHVGQMFETLKWPFVGETTTK